MAVARRYAEQREAKLRDARISRAVFGTLIIPGILLMCGNDPIWTIMVITILNFSILINAAV